MASLLSSNQTLSQIQSLANASSAKIGRVTLSRTSSHVLPSELKCSAKSSTKPLNVNATQPSRPLERTKSQWQIELAPKSTKPKAIATATNAGETPDGGIIYELSFLFMTTLEVFFFGPYDTATAAIDVPAK